MTANLKKLCKAQLVIFCGAAMSLNAHANQISNGGFEAPVTGPGGFNSGYTAYLVGQTIGAFLGALLAVVAFRWRLPPGPWLQVLVVALAGAIGWSLAGGALATAASPRAALFVMVALYVLVPLRLYISPIGRVRTVDELTPAVTPA